MSGGRTALGALLVELLACSCSLAAPPDADAQAVRPDASGVGPVEHLITTSDGLVIPTLEYRTDASRGRPFVLLFHQGGASGLAEYAPIIPRLLGLDLNVLVIDQRRGGDLFGGVNPLAASLDADAISYCDVRPDLEAALDHARAEAPERQAILWGSSYSAALVIALAAERPNDVAGVLAFSPASGEPMAGCEPEPFVDRLESPLLVVRPSSEMELGWISEQLDLFRSHGHRTYVADPGRHGSSTLVERRVGADTSPTWAVVESFLAEVVAQAPVRRR